MSNLPSTALLLVGLSLGLTGCGGGEEAGANGATAAPGGFAMPGSESKAKPLTLAEGPDVCFRAIAKHLGADAKVSEINSFFSSGKEIDGNDRQPEGELTVCSVEYQNPADPRKLLSTSLSAQTGTFSEPRPVEITVMGGEAAAFKLDDYIIPLSQVNAAALAAIMKAQEARLKGVYSKYAWSGVRLSAPGPFSDVHTLRLDVDGRLASNDIKQNGYASISVDGKKITTDHLLP